MQNKNHHFRESGDGDFDFCCSGLQIFDLNFFQVILFQRPGHLLDKREPDSDLGSCGRIIRIIIDLGAYDKLDLIGFSQYLDDTLGRIFRHVFEKFFLKGTGLT